MTWQSKLLAAALALVPAFARADDAKKSDTTSSSMQTKLTDDKVLRKLHHVNLEEVNAGQLAQQKSASKDVKDYGAMLVRDHQKADQDVKTVASKLNIDVEAKKTDADRQTKADADHQAKRQAKEHQLDELQKLTGRAFDRSFLQMMVNGHREVIAMVKSARNDAKPEVRDLLDKLLPVLQRHEDRANELLDKMGNTASAK